MVKVEYLKSVQTFSWELNIFQKDKNGIQQGFDFVIRRFEASYPAMIAERKGYSNTPPPEELTFFEGFAV